MGAAAPESRHTMKWQGRRQSTNVNDQRGRPVAGRTVAKGGLGVVAALVLFLLTGNGSFLTDLLGGGVQAPPAPSGRESGYTETAREKTLFEYVSVALADIEDTWNQVLPRSQYRAQYEEPRLTIYNDYVDTACGSANSGVGPFCCPGDKTIYLDLSFYDTLVQRYGAQDGDFVMTYVIAHEAGHHVQTLLGVTRELSALRQQAASGAISQADFNRYSVAYELQADYLAGVVARYMQQRGYLERGDLTEAMSAAAAVGDDAIQQKAQGYADPDTFNHGTSEQRQEWFKRGYEAGDLSDWDTFREII